MEIKTIQIDSDTFLVFKGIEYRQINVEDIVSLEALNKYVLIVTKGLLINKKYLLELTKKTDDKDKYLLVLNDSEHTTREVSSYIAKNILEQL